MASIFLFLVLGALWECLPVYLGHRTPHMTDGHLHHLSGPIVCGPYRIGPSARRVDSPSALLTLWCIFTLLDGRCREGCGSTACGALIAPMWNRHLTPASSEKLRILKNSSSLNKPAVALTSTVQTAFISYPPTDTRDSGLESCQENTHLRKAWQSVPVDNLEFAILIRVLSPRNVELGWNLGLNSQI